MSSRRPPLRSNILVIPLLASLVSLQCFRQPLEPVAPNWDIQFSVPLVDTVRTVQEIVDRDTSVLQFDPVTNLIYYNFRELIVSDTVGNRMKMFPDSMRFKVTIGVLGMDSIQVSGSATSPIPPGTYPVFPDTSVSIPSLSDTVGGFSSLTFESGIAELTVTNSLPVGLTLDTVTLSDGMGRVVASFGFSGILEPDSARTVADNLAGRSMDNSLTLSTSPLRDSIELSFRGDTNVVFTAQSGVGFAIRLTNLFVASATANIPSQRIFSSDSALFVADDSTLVDSAFFKSGSFTLQMTNHVDLTVRARLRLPDLRDAVSNAVFDTAIFFQPFQSIAVPVDITRYEAISTTGSPTNLLWYTAELDSVQGSPATVNRDDSLTAVVIPGSELVLRSALIVVEPTFLDVDTSYGLTLGDLPSSFGADSLFLPQAALLLDSMRTVVEAQVDNNLMAAVRDSSGLYVDTIRYTGAPVLFRPPPVTLDQNRMVIDSSNSNIVQVMSNFVAQPQVRNLPDTVAVFGAAILNPNYDLTPRTIADTTRIKGKFDVIFPINLGLKNGTFEDSASIAGKVGLDQDDINRFNRGTLTIEVENSLPASLKLDLSLRRENPDSVWTIPHIPVDSLFVGAANIGTDGFSNQSTHRLISLQLDRLDVRRLSEAEYLRFGIRINTSGSPSVQSAKFRTTDSVRLRISGTLIFHVSF